MHQQWTTVLTPKTSALDLNLQELWQHRDIIGVFIKRYYIVFYKQTVLGPAWIVIKPLLTTVVFTVVFGNVAQMSTNGLPKFLFYMAGNILWTVFSSTLTNVSATFKENARVFGKVYFPRLSVPIASLICSVLTFLIQFVVFAGILIYYVAKGIVHPNVWALLAPVLVMMAALLGMGCGLIVASLTTKYKDLITLVGFGVQLWMYATPIVYPLSEMTGAMRNVMQFNPMTPVVEAFRFGFLGDGIFSWLHLAIAAVVTTLILFAGLLLFNRMEKSFVDTI